MTECENCERLRAENERLKELEDVASSCLVEANTIENQLRAEIAEARRETWEKAAKYCNEWPRLTANKISRIFQAEAEKDRGS